MSEKVKVKSIKITRAEGKIHECGKPVFAIGYDDADKILRKMCANMPDERGYDKCDFVITFDNEDTYSGCYLLKHFGIDSPYLKLTDHITSHLRGIAGEANPDLVKILKISIETQEQAKAMLRTYELSSEPSM